MSCRRKQWVPQWKVRPGQRQRPRTARSRQVPLLPLVQSWVLKNKEWLRMFRSVMYIYKLFNQLDGGIRRYGNANEPVVFQMKPLEQFRVCDKT